MEGEGDMQMRQNNRILLFVLTALVLLAAAGCSREAETSSVDPQIRNQESYEAPESSSVWKFY